MACALIIGVMTPVSGVAKPPIKLFDESASTASEEGEAAGPVIRYGHGDGEGATSASGEVDQVLRPKIVRAGTSKLIEAKVGGEEVLFLLDTGASYTTITPWLAKKIGVTPRGGGPSATFRTASGTLEAPFGVVSSFKLDGQELGPVTFSLCQACGEENLGGEIEASQRKVVGLLGMNVLGRFRMQIDGDALDLAPGQEYANRVADINPWLHVARVEQKSFDLEREDQVSWVFEVEVENKSKQRVKRAMVAMNCRSGEEVFSTTAVVDGIPARKSAVVKLELAQAPRDCARGDVVVTSASW